MGSLFFFGLNSHCCSDNLAKQPVQVAVVVAAVATAVVAAVPIPVYLAAEQQWWPAAYIVDGQGCWSEANTSP